MRSFVVLSLAVACFAQTPPPKPPASKAPASKPPAAPAKPAASAPPAADPIVLTIGAEKITKSQWEEFVAALPEQLQTQVRGPNRRKVAEQIAEMKMMSQEARKRKLDQTAQVRAQIALQHDNVLANALYQEMMKNTKADDAALHAYYDQHKSEYQQVKARHILVRMQGSRVPVRANQKELSEAEALAKAQELRKRIAGGEDFAAVAKAESDDTGSGATGGDLGTFGHGQMVGPFDEAVFKLPVGEISEPVKTPFGFHLIQVQEQVSKSFDEARGEIEQKMGPDLAKQAIENLKKQTPVTVDEAYFGK